MAVPRNRDGGDQMSSTLAAIEDRIEELESEIAKVAPLAVERERLIRARAAILGEAPQQPTGGPPARRITQDDVAEALRRRPGSRAGELARYLGAGQPAISAHLYRGKQSRFECRGGRWYLAAAE
jgi:hypothetical protein